MVSVLAKESRLLVLFREATNNTPIEYLIKLRISRAKELLIGTNRTVEEIALSCGFNDGNYFSRQFRKTTGITPREFRKQAVALGNFSRAEAR